MPLRSGMRGARLVGAGWLAASMVLAARTSGSEPKDPWAPGSQWFSFRAGYAKSAAAGAPDGNVGFGFAYTRMWSQKWALSAVSQADVLGRFGQARLMEFPWTFEATRHFRWPTSLRPYLGLGAGAYFESIAGTNDPITGIARDGTKLVPGIYGTWGANAVAGERSLVGFDVRLSVLPATFQRNPVFGAEVTAGEHQSRVVHWSVKLGYSRVY